MQYIDIGSGITMRRRKSAYIGRKVSFIIFVLIVLCGGFYFWWERTISPVDPSNTQTKNFDVHNGEGTREIAAQLKSNGLINDPIAFFILVRLSNLDGKLQAGEFHLSASMSSLQIAKSLQTGTFDFYVTIPEGKRAEEIAGILKDKIPSFQEAWEDKLIAQEGYLFPDTYSFPANATIDLIVQTMTSNFEKKYEGISNNNHISLAKKDIVTIASIVEREARYPQDRQLVASVIINRLKAGMPLQIDSTVQYAMGFQPDTNTWWTNNLTVNDLHINSPFNTYVNTGLPPTPISNPGLSSLIAVIQAPQTNYLFYISDKTGHNHYEETADQHTADMQKYGL